MQIKSYENDNYVAYLISVQWILSIGSFFDYHLNQRVLFLPKRLELEGCNAHFWNLLESTKIVFVTL
jgi:hypothetical protein